MINNPKFTSGTGFPNQFAPDKEKETLEYGLRVGQAIESEWFSRDRGSSLYGDMRSEYLLRRLYARAEQPVEKYKNELSINGDLSYLNLDWTPVAIIPKYVDIVVNGIANRLYDVKVEAVDSYSSEIREDFRKEMEADMIAYQPLKELKEQTGVDIFNFEEGELPRTTEELGLYMKLKYKQGIEIAEETAINSLLELNDYEELSKRTTEDNVVLGISAIKHSFDVHDGVRIEYVDPVNLIYSPTEDPSFKDCYYYGEVKNSHVTELKKINPNLTQEELEDLAKTASRLDGFKSTVNQSGGSDNSNVSLLYFCYKTDKEIVYKIKETVNGGQKPIKKDSSFNPEGETERFVKASRRIDVWYEGVMVLGSNKLIKWELMQNMVRPKSAFQKTCAPYLLSAPKMTKGKVDSLVKRMIPFADQIQLVHLKLQQVVSKMIPDGVFIDADGLNSVDLGNGASYNPSEALSMYFQTGSVIGRSYTEDGEFNNARVPIQELTSSGSNAKISSLINMYNYQLNMIRAATGINEARDGSSPDQYSLVGVQKLAALNSNTATRHVVQAGINITKELCTALSYRISDILKYSSFSEDFAKMIGKNNFQVISEIQNLHLHDFGIYIELEPDEEEKSLLEQNIQLALQSGKIDLDDVIDLRMVNNLHLANMLLKVRKARKEENDMSLEEKKTKMQTEANSQSAQSAAQARTQENNIKAQSEAQMLQMTNKMDLQKLEVKAKLEKELEQMKFEHAMELKKLEIEGFSSREGEKEDRKDKRTEKQASQQSKMISQRKKDLPPTDFENGQGQEPQGQEQGLGGLEMPAMGGQPQQPNQDPMAGMMQQMNQQNML
tara:strand:+ start:3838 stop:6348 length:2511 start_codon:yes stop_codon:yes gene_type:complete